MWSALSNKTRSSLWVAYPTKISLFCASFSSKPSFDPLRILFCGSDEFSIASLNALHAEHKKNPACIASLDVVCRPPKPTGRGLKRFREVPIAGEARYLGLPLHQIDTFRGWQPPRPGELPINLVIAVSFGLLVPPRILGAAKFGGLNVHPSLLPDLRGPAPLHHTLLQRRTRTGVTVQTLHPTHFDQGSIVAQTPQPGFEHHCSNVPDLLRITSQEGASLLLKSIRNGDFVQPEYRAHTAHEQGLQSAPKITPEDRHINWATWTANEIMLRHRVIGPLWNALHTKTVMPAMKRLVWSSGFEYSELIAPPSAQVGQPFILKRDEAPATTFVTTCDGKVLQTSQVTFEGQKSTDPIRGAKHAGHFSEDGIMGLSGDGQGVMHSILLNGDLR